MIMLISGEPVINAVCKVPVGITSSRTKIALPISSAAPQLNPQSFTFHLTYILRQPVGKLPSTATLSPTETTLPFSLERLNHYLRLFAIRSPF